MADTPEQKKKPTLFKRLRQGGINKELTWSLLMSLVSSGLGFIFSMLCSYYLQATAYGEAQYYISIVSTLSTLMTFGSDSYLVKTVQFAEDKKYATSRVCLFNTIAGVLILPFYLVVAYLALNRLNGNIWLILTIYVAALTVSLLSLTKSYFIGQKKQQISTLLTGILPHIGFLIIFLCHYLTGTLDLFLDLYVVYYAVTILIVLIPWLAKIATFRRPKFQPSEVLSILFMGSAVAFQFLASPIGNIVSGELISTAVVGIIGLSQQLMKIVQLLTTVVLSMSRPVFAKLAKETDKTKYRDYFQMVARVNMTFALPFYAAFAMECQQVLSLFGDSYVKDGYAPMLALISASSAIAVLVGAPGSVLLMSGHEKMNAASSLARLVSYIAVLAATVHFTPYASPIALLISQAIASLMNSFLVWKTQGLNFVSWKVFMPGIAMLGISLAAFYGLTYIQNTVLWLVLNCLLGGGLILLFYLCSPFKDWKFFTEKGEAF